MLILTKGTPWYIIGHNLSGTDIYVDSEDGVSGCHLRLGFDEWGQVVIKDTSTFGCRLTYIKKGSTSGSEKEEDDRLQRTVSKGNKKNPPTWVLPVGWKVIVAMGDCDSAFTFQVPDHSDYFQEYQKRVLEFQAVQNNPVSFLGGLGLNSQRATTRGRFSAAQRATLDGKAGRYAWITSDRTLGEGTFGEVFEVFNTTNWCMCAGKRMKTEMTFQNESSVLRRLQHKHIVQYIDVEERRPTSPSMIIMEYYSLGDLKKQHKTKKFSQTEIIEIIVQASSALEYLHEQKITHRDLKPANILVRSRQPVEIALTDFGVAKSEESVMSTYTGTYPYMAPEVVSNNPETTKRHADYTSRVDIWSLGVVAVEMLLGGLPKSVSDLYDQSYASNIYKTRDKLLARCENRDFAALVKDMLEWSQFDRPSAAECLERASCMALVAQRAGIDDRTEDVGRRRGKSPAGGVSSGSAASTVRVVKRVGSDMTTVKPPTKKPSAAGPSTTRDPSRELESLMRHELENDLAPTSASGAITGRSAGGTCSTPGASVWRELGTAPPTKSSAAARGT